MTAAASATTAEVHLLSDDLTEAPIPPAPAVIKAPAPGDSPLRAAAKNYVSQGWHIFPVDGEKRPKTPRGFKDSSLNPLIVSDHDGIGIATGQVSGLVVVDLDEKNGKHGIQAFKDLMQGHPEIVTRTVKTPTGGAHLYFKHSGPLKTRIDHPAPGIDFKADGGYIVAPPTVLKNGDFYTTVKDVEPTDLPDWLKEIMTAPGREEQSVPAAPGQARIKEPYKAPDTIPAGRRNDSLYRTACSLASKGIGDSAVLAAVMQMNQDKCSPALDQEEVRGIVQHACDFNRQSPAVKPVGSVPAQPAPQANLIISTQDPKTQKTAPANKERSYIIDGDTLFLSCINNDNVYSFVHIDGDKLVFDPSYNGCYPRKLQVKDGVPVAIVGIPSRESLESAQPTTAPELYAAIDKHLKKYLDAPDIDREMFIYYCLYSWYHQKTNTAPYLRFIADTGNGKSRFQRVTGDLTFYPIKAGGSSTPSGIMRIKEKWNGTLLIDEADLRESSTTNELVKYLNLGFEKGQYFIKTDKDNPKEQDIFDPFCPKVIAMRHPFQDNATEGRLLSFTPKETTRKDIPIILPATYNDEVDCLRAGIAIFVMRNWASVDGEKIIDLREATIEPRLKQLAIPLSIVLQLFPDGESRLKTYLNMRQKEVQRTRASSLEGMTFNSVLDWVQDQRDDKGHLTAVEVKDRCGLRSTTAATKILHSIGFKTEVIREGKLIRVLIVPDQNTWNGIVQRYYFSDKNEKLECPKQLRGPRFVTLDTLVTLTVHGLSPVKDKNDTTVSEYPCTGSVTTVTSVSEPVPEKMI